jgi:hypothetical protein
MRGDRIDVFARAPHHPAAMAACAFCQKPVVNGPDMLSDGRLVHASCKQRITGVNRRPTPPKGTPTAAVPPRKTSSADVDP